MDFWFKRKPNAATAKMIVPGRRALGEDWSEVTIRPRNDGGYDTEVRPAPAPANRQPVIIPGMSDLSDEELNFILGAAQKKAEYEARHPYAKKMTPEENQKWATNLWQEYLQAKIAALKGVSQFGPAGKTQREKVSR